MHILRVSRNPNHSHSLVNFALQHTADIVRREGTHEFVHNLPVTANNERLWHTIDSPFDRGAAVAVETDDAELIAVAAEEAQGVIEFILVIDADELQPDGNLRSPSRIDMRLVA